MIQDFYSKTSFSVSTFCYRRQSSYTSSFSYSRLLKESNLDTNRSTVCVCVRILENRWDTNICIEYEERSDFMFYS
jgi:hypothetical protein